MTARVELLIFWRVTLIPATALDRSSRVFDSDSGRALSKNWTYPLLGKFLPNPGNPWVFIGKSSPNIRTIQVSEIFSSTHIYIYNYIYIYQYISHHITMFYG